MANTGARAGLTERALATTQPKPPSIMQLIDRQQEEVRRALPTHLQANAASFTRALITVVKQTPALQDCDPTTILGGLLTASQLGLEFGSLGHCYLVPFKDRKTGKSEAQFILGYKGKIDLAWRSGKLLSIAARTVHEGDEFDFDFGLADSLHHKPNPREAPGPAYAWYMVAKFQGGGHYFNVLSRADVERHRKSSRGSDSNFSPWVTNYDQMAMKSCIHKGTPYLPLTTEVMRQMAMDDVVARGATLADLQVDEAAYLDVNATTGEIAPQPNDNEPAPAELLDGDGRPFEP